MSKLLIVDDEQDIRDFAKSFFEKRKISCFTAANGREAITLTKNENPDLILLDIRMEEANGLDVLEKIREFNQTVKVIMVSGVEEKEALDKAKALGALAYIHKPLILEELEKIVLKELNV
ncbi:MAG: response regulator [Candidatus Omnitrophota bacterium]|nr:response regulator [Candidatus Omnitrophota bacterium]